MKKEKQSQGWLIFILSIFAWLGKNFLEIDSPANDTTIDPYSKKFRTPEDDRLMDEVRAILKQYPHISWNESSVPAEVVERMKILEAHFERRAREALSAHDGSVIIAHEGKTGYEKFVLFTAPYGEQTFLESLADPFVTEEIDVEKLLCVQPGT